MLYFPHSDYEQNTQCQVELALDAIVRFCFQEVANSFHYFAADYVGLSGRHFSDFGVFESKVMFSQYSEYMIYVSFEICSTVEVDNSRFYSVDFAPAKSHIDTDYVLENLMQIFLQEPCIHFDKGSVMRMTDLSRNIYETKKIWFNVYMKGDGTPYA